MILIYYIALTLSFIGYGFALSKFLNLNFKNFGYFGFLGISFLTLISYITSLFFIHDYLFNIIILIPGLIFFIFTLKLESNLRNKIYEVSIIFLLLIIFIYVKKNHDDFGYYHFPYTYLLTQIEHPLGLGQLNNGFRNHSSLFFLSSLFYLPGASINLLHIAPVYYLGFSNLIFLNFIRDKDIFSDIKFSNFFALLAFSFVNIFFYRLAEHGTDRSGMIIVFLLILILTNIQNQKDKVINYNNIYFSCILLTLLISLKTYYIIYIPLVLYFLIDILKINFFHIFKTKIFYYCFLFFSITIFYNFINSGCLIYPAAFTCFEDIYWTINKDTIQEVNIWYELWAKAGASPNYVVDDRLQYIQNFNWVLNWIENYFFNKVSDFLIGLIVLITIFFIFFKKYKKEHNRTSYMRFNVLILIIIVYLIEWFFKHPALRYGGYHLIAILCFIPFCIWFNKLKINFEQFHKKSVVIILIVTLIFFTRNLIRINKETKIYGNNSIINYSYNFDDKFYNRYLYIIKENEDSYKRFKKLGLNFLITKK